MRSIPGGAVVKNPPASAGDARDEGSLPGSGGSPGVGNGNLLQYSCLGSSHGQRSLMGCTPWSWTWPSAHACGKHAPRRPGCALVVGACWGSFPQLPSIRKPHPAFFWAQVGSRSGQAQRTCEPSGRFQRKPAVPFVLLRARKHALLSRMLSSLSFSVLLFFLWFS